MLIVSEKDHIVTACAYLTFLTLDSGHCKVSRDLFMANTLVTSCDSARTNRHCTGSKMFNEHPVRLTLYQLLEFF